jgi:hypothetical protein
LPATGILFVWLLRLGPLRLVMLLRAGLDPLDRWLRRYRRRHGLPGLRRGRLGLLTPLLTPLLSRRRLATTRPPRLLTRLLTRLLAPLR